MAKRDIDKDFTFSTRVRSSAGAERDYFIGTEKSNYFGFTLWDISVSYPGSSMDLIDFFFEDVDKSFKFVIECRQTNNPEGKQNESALKLIRLIREQIGNIGTVIFKSKENGKDFNLLYQLPTGGGKTVIFSELTRRYINDWKKKVLVLTHRVELSIQTSKQLDARGVSSKIINSDCIYEITKISFTFSYCS
jgi:type I site-specific restriction endonuclease